MKVFKIYVSIILILLLTGCTVGGKVLSPTATIPARTENINVEPTLEPSPTAKLPLSGLKICIDAGHQAKANNELEPVAPWKSETKAKVSSGTQGIKTKITEYEINLQISKKIRDSLVILGAEVLMVRENHNVNISNKERAEMANEFGAHLTFRIHCNGSDNASIKGIEIYMRDKGDGSEKQNILANLENQIANELMASLVKNTEAINRNVRKSDIYTGINWSKVPCLIIECGYLSNLEEEALLITDEYQNKIAEGFTQFVLETKLIKY